MAIDFPNSPSVNDSFTVGNRTWIWDGTAWELLTTASDPIQKTIVDAKGDLIGGTGSDTVARLAVGSNGQVLVADSGETTGLKWGDVGEPVAFTPSFTNLTLGNGTTDFTYTIIGKTMFVTGRLVFGTTTSVTGNIEVTLPASATSNVWAIGQLYIRDFGAGTYGGFSALTDGDTGISFSNMYVSGSTVLHQTVNATTPITWANNDQLAFSITADIS